MGSHRADHRAPRPEPASTESGSTYVGKRAARRPVDTEQPSTYVGKRVARPAEPIAPATPIAPAAPVIPVAVGLDRAPTVELPALRDIPLFDPLVDSSTSQLRAIQPAGKRRAVRHAGTRGPLFKGLPTLPVAVGVATLAVAVGGAVVSADPQLAASADRVTASNAMTGSFGNGSVSERVETLSRDSDRDALQQGDGDLKDAVTKMDAERNTALDSLAKAAEKEAAEIALNRWTLPLKSYRLTAKFGEYGLWSSYHTGLDFAAPVGTPIYAVTNGTVTSAQFDGAYGNKTVLTLDDGTELWFCHQTAFNVSPGDKVRTGQLIGYVGATGHVTGPHMHLEVRPGGGDPVDPDAALRQHGVTP